MSKKIIAVVLALVTVLALSLVSCTPAENNKGAQLVEVMDAEERAPYAGKKIEGVKVGFIFLHDENSTYDKNFMEAAEAACKYLGLEKSDYIMMVNVPEGNECKEAAEDLIDQGCNLIFADSFGHEAFLLEVAKAHPEVQFCHATGTMAHTEDLDNFHNAFASIYEGRFLAGVAAGLKLNEMIQSGKITADKAKMGYVGAFPYAEVISGYSSFYLGAKSVCPTVTMDVTFTNSWYDVNAERDSANALISRGCVLISQHADSMGAPSACEEKGVPNVSYNGSTAASCPNTFIVSSRINWQPYFEYIITSVNEDKAIATDWTGTIATGSVVLTGVNTTAAAEGTVAKLKEVIGKLKDGTLKVFDTATFTVPAGASANATVDANGKLTGYMADVDTDAAFTGDTQVVKDGYFDESSFRSAPYFDLAIVGITRLDSAAN